MANDTVDPPPNPISPDSIFRFQVTQYQVVACLTVSLHFTLCLSPRLHRERIYTSVPDTVILQLCVWDWLLALSDEYQMICQGHRRHRYLLYIVYLISR